LNPEKETVLNKKMEDDRRVLKKAA
jgi:hypothetical protein